MPLLVMTFVICWFVVLMQMLWSRADEIVGRGLDTWVLIQLLFHAAVMALPTATPLGILLASVMTFGGLGERLELLAMKSAGVPLYRIMSPLFVVGITIGLALFVYLNTAMMDAQVKFFQIIFSAQQSRPDLEIPQGVFYNQIPGYSLFVKKKDHENHGSYWQTRENYKWMPPKHSLPSISTRARALSNFLRAHSSKAPAVPPPTIETCLPPTSRSIFRINALLFGSIRTSK